MFILLQIGCHDVWTIFNENIQKNAMHSFMVLARDGSTTVLQTGAEINDVVNSGFCCNQTTIHVGNIGNGRFIVQVLSKSIRLLQGTRLLQNIQVDIDSPIVQVSICDPYVCAQTQSGAVISWALRESKGMIRLAMNKNAISSVSINQMRMQFILKLTFQLKFDFCFYLVFYLVTSCNWLVYV